jgi:Holliday junction resolvase RusA-like endonuclease
LEGRISARLVFLIDRPKTHMGSGRNAGTVRPAMREKYPFPGGDIDNFAKGPLDALKGVAFRDDRQVTDLSVSKRWTGPGEDAGVLVALDQYER